MSEHSSVPRGRHAPPLEVRQDRQRRRLSDAAASVFARVGYADATAEAIAREAGMSKATFYEHFGNKEDCILALFDAATERLIAEMRSAAGSGGDGERVPPARRVRESVGALLGVMADERDYAQTLLVEIIGAGPRAIARRDNMLAAFASYIEQRNAEDAEVGAAPRLASPDDAFAIVGAIFELASRQIRTGVPADIRALEPVVERLFAGMLWAAEGHSAAT